MVTFFVDDEKTNVHIVDSYKIVSDYGIGLNCTEIHDKYPEFQRSVGSWVEEWKAHNLLYYLGIAKKRTGSVDLNEREPQWRLTGYKILSFIYDMVIAFLV